MLAAVIILFEFILFKIKAAAMCPYNFFCNAVKFKFAAIFTKKTFSNIKNNADPQNVLDVANAIKGILAEETGDCFLTESSVLSE